MYTVKRKSTVLLFLVIITGILFLTGCEELSLSGSSTDLDLEEAGTGDASAGESDTTDANTARAAEREGTTQPGDEVIGPGEVVTITRDTWGVAHVYAETDEGAFAGMGYATAQDRLFQMYRLRAAMRGQLGELIGDASGKSVAIDKSARIRGLAEAAELQAQNLDETSKRILDAYSYGVNRYIEGKTEDLLYLFDGEVPEPWTPADSLLVWGNMDTPGAPNKEVINLHAFDKKVQELGSVKDATIALYQGKVIDDSAETVKQSDVPVGTQQKIEQYAKDHPVFGAEYLPDGGIYDAEDLPEGTTRRRMSQSWAVSGDRSNTGEALHCGHPQVPVLAPTYWHEIRVKGKTFDMRGVTMAGFPGYFVGFSNDVSWSMTSLGADMADIFRLKMVGPNQYEYDGKTYDIDIHTEEIKVKGQAPQTVTLKRTMLGPVVTELLPNATQGEEYILRAIPLWDEDKHSIQATYKMMQAKNVYEFHDALENWRAPALNTVFADSEGNIGYAALAAIPTRSSLSPLAGMVAQDGSSSAHDWVGTVPSDVMPHVINPKSGAIFSGNHLPAGTWYPVKLRGPQGDTLRSWRLRELLEEDGPSTWTPEEFSTIIKDAVNPSRREIVRAGLHLRDVQRHRLSREALSVLQYLEEWYNDGAEVLVSHPYTALAMSFPDSFREDVGGSLALIYGGGDSGLASTLKEIKEILDNNPSADLDSDQVAFIVNYLEGAATNVQVYGRDPAQWQRKYQEGPATVTLPYFHSFYEPTGSIDPTADRTYVLSNVDRSTVASPIQQAYSHCVDFSDIDSSLAVLPVGVSEDPRSPHFSDQGSLWEDNKLRRAPLGHDAVREMETSAERVTMYLEQAGIVAKP